MARKCKKVIDILRSKEGQEIDLVLERAGERPLLIEIKSTREVQERHLNDLTALSSEFNNPKLLCFSQEPTKRVVNDVLILPWREGLQEIELAN